MATVNRLMTNLCSNNLEASKSFYTSLFDLTAAYDSDWFVHLQGGNSALELGIISATSEIVPKDVVTTAGGSYLTFVVDNVDAVFEKAKAAGFDVTQAPHDTFYGQRRLLLRDPDGMVVDVSAPIPGFQP